MSYEMTTFAIIEVDSGLVVVPVPLNATAESVAVEHGGVVTDPGPFHAYEDAYDALLAIPDPDEGRPSE